MDMWSANQRRYSRGLNPDFWGARASRVLVSASRRNRLCLDENFRLRCVGLRKVRDREDALTSTRDARAPRRAGRANHCAHSSNAAGSPRKSARTSPTKCSEPVIRIGLGFARASISASPMVGVMEWGSDGVMTEKILANSPGAMARSLRIFGRITEPAIGASTSQIPRKSLSERTARMSVAF